MYNENYRILHPGDAPVRPHPADGVVRPGDAVRYLPGWTPEHGETGLVTHTRRGAATVRWTTGEPSTVPVSDLRIIDR